MTPQDEVHSDITRAIVRQAERKYGEAGQPAHLIIDPLNGECTLLQSPEHGAYQEENVLPFGTTVRVRRRDGSEFALDTTKFPRS